VIHAAKLTGGVNWRNGEAVIHAAKLTGGLHWQDGGSSDPCSETYRWDKLAGWGKQ
jgi:hypothetical protein